MAQSRPSCPRRLLVVGFGNTLRRDDAAGPAVAEAIAALSLPGVQVVVRHQLTPELAEVISHADAVVFVDASIEAQGEAELRDTQPGDGFQTLVHATDPGSLLALSRDLFGRSPRSWTLTIPAEDFALGDGLSPLAQAGVARAVQEIQRLAEPLDFAASCA